MGRCAGAVLTGGAGRRMGGGKPLVIHRGLPLGRWVVDALRDGGCDPIVTVGGDADALAPLGADDHIVDRWPGEGPLAGTVAALHAQFASDPAPEFVLVAACDLAHLDAATVRRVVSAPADADIAVARGDRLHPSLTRYSRSAATVAADRFEAGERAMHRFISSAPEFPGDVRVVEIDVDERRLANLNTPDDLDR